MGDREAGSDLDAQHAAPPIAQGNEEESSFHQDMEFIQENQELDVGERRFQQMENTIRMLQDSLLASQQNHVNTIQELQERLSAAEASTKSTNAVNKMLVDISVKMDLEVPVDELFPYAVEEIKKLHSYRFDSCKVITPETNEKPFLDLPSVLLGNFGDTIDTNAACHALSTAVALYLSTCTDKTTVFLPFVTDKFVHDNVESLNAGFFSGVKSRGEVRNIIGMVNHGINFTTCFAEKDQGDSWYCLFMNNTDQNENLINSCVSNTFAKSLLSCSGFEISENSAKLVNCSTKERHKSRYDEYDFTWFQNLCGTKPVQNKDSVLDSVRVAFAIVDKSINSEIDSDLYDSMLEIVNQYQVILGCCKDESIIDLYKSNFECFKNLDENRLDKDLQDKDSEDEDRLWPWRNLSPMEKMYLANELREAGLCKPMKYCREWKYNGPPEYSLADMIYTIKDIVENEVVITNEQMEMQWVKELIGDFMRVEFEEPEWRDDNLNKELLYKLDTKMVEKVVKAHHFLRRVHSKIMNEEKKQYSR